MHVRLEQYITSLDTSLSVGTYRQYACILFCHSRVFLTMRTLKHPADYQTKEDINKKHKSEAVI